MRKREELTNPASCMSRAKDDEMTFVLLGRDVAAPVAIRKWVAERIVLGKNAYGDAQLREALECAETMEREQKVGVQAYAESQPEPHPAAPEPSRADRLARYSVKGRGRNERAANSIFGGDGQSHPRWQEDADAKGG